MMLMHARLGEISPPRQVNHRVPAALEAICQKAMNRSPGDRYASPRAVADEIEHWLADEPVSAWKEPWAVRARRWAARHRTPVAAAAAALVVAALAIGNLLNDYQLRIAEQSAQADGLVVALRAAEVGEVGGIARQLRPLQWLVRERLRSMAQPGSPESGNARRNAALALLPTTRRRQNTSSTGSCGKTSIPRKSPLFGNPWSTRSGQPFHNPALATLGEGTRTGLAEPGCRGALALFMPQDPQWSELGPPIATALVSNGPLLIGDWREVFQPINQQLVGPLRAIFGEISRPREERALAFSLLIDFAVQPGNAARDLDLAELIADASPNEFLVIQRALRDPRKAVTALLAKLDQEEPVDENAARMAGESPQPDRLAVSRSRVAITGALSLC